jgi:O-antigen/teichoic acid export membrane protein
MLPSMVITNALQPAVAQLIRSPDQHALEPLLRRMATLTTLPVLAAALALQLFGEQLVTLVFGPTYAAGTGVLLVLAIGNLIFAWCGAPGLVLSMSGHQRTNMAIYLLTVLLTVVFGIPAMWAFGMMGVAVTIGLLGFANKLLTMWVTNREFGIRTDVTFQFLGSPAPASE